MFVIRGREKGKMHARRLLFLSVVPDNSAGKEKLITHDANYHGIILLTSEG